MLTFGGIEIERTSETQERVFLEEATEGDLELVMAWRSNPLVFQGFYLQKDPLTWTGHLSFWSNRSDRRDWLILLQEGNVIRKVGSASVSRLSESTPEVGIYVGEVTLWGKGVGRKAVIEVMKWLKVNGYRSCYAAIREDNIASQRMFAAVGFHRAGPGRFGESLYEVILR